MKLNFKKQIQLLVTVLMLAGSMPVVTSCADEDMSKTVADYDPRYKGTVAFGNSDYNLDANAQEIEIPFSSDQSWTATLKSGDAAPDWATVSPESGEAGDKLSVKVKLDANEDLKNSRQVTLTITTEKGNTKTVTIAQNYKVVVLDPAEIKDYAKYICPTSGNEHFEKGADYMLRQDSYYSWHRMKQSDHFFVFWSPEFGDDPNAESVSASMRVDIDDLLAKAEKYFNTNINTLGMAKLGEGKSMLDNYKMQIYLIYQDDWLATGSGYDNKIGALWVNPSTCQPVGSTIGHEIGHSFQYQVYADKVNCQGYAADLKHGFRYGFNNSEDPNTAGGNGFWEQCAQWQAQLDYPSEMFGYHLDVWQKNYFRHFNHPWMRYASYWFQHVMVEKNGIDAFGKLWRESEFPEDPLQAYQRLFCNNDQNKLYEDLYYYASHMVNYDLKFAKSTNEGVEDVVVPETAKGAYSTSLYRIGSDDESYIYQVGYASCPGTTGFNVIELDVPAAGKTVNVDVQALAVGSDLAKGDKGEQLDGDMKVVGTTKTYNKQENTGSSFRFGYVAVVNGQNVYTEMKQGGKGAAEYTVPQGTSNLYFVIQAAPTTYHPITWQDTAAEQNAADEQWPYTIKVTGTDVSEYIEVVDVNIPAGAQPEDGKSTTVIIKDVPTDAGYDGGTINLAYYDNAALCYAFALTPEQIAEKLVKSNAEGWTLDKLNEGEIAMGLQLPDGTYNFTDNQGGTYAGYWMDGEGNLQGWGSDARTFISLASIYELTYGFMPISEGHTAGTIYKASPVMFYKKGGKIYKFTFNLQFKVAE